MYPSPIRAVAISAALIAVSFPAAVSAQSLRCNGDLAQIGNSRATVVQKCGEPIRKDTFCEPAVTAFGVPAAAPNSMGVIVGSSVTVNSCRQIEEWSYNPGGGQFMTMLQFEGSSLKSIRYGDRIK